MMEMQPQFWTVAMAREDVMEYRIHVKKLNAHTRVCQENGRCSVSTGKCDFPWKPVGTPCRSNNVLVSNAQCNAQHLCMGTTPSLPQRYVGPFGVWGWTCCVMISVVVDGPVSVIQLTATSDVASLQEYSLEIQGAKVNGQTTDLDITLPDISLKAGETFILTDNFTQFQAMFNVNPTKYQTNLPTLTGDEEMKLTRSSQKSIEYLIDYFPPTNDSSSYDWKNGYALRDVKNGWILNSDAFEKSGNVTVSLDGWDVFGPFVASCMCQAANADDFNAQGQPICNTADHPATKDRLVSFTSRNLDADSTFGKGMWHFILPGTIEAMKGKWRCSAVPV